MTDDNDARKNSAFMILPKAYMNIVIRAKSNDTMSVLHPLNFRRRHQAPLSVSEKD